MTGFLIFLAVWLVLGYMAGQIDKAINAAIDEETTVGEMVFLLLVGGIGLVAAVLAYIMNYDEISRNKIAKPDTVFTVALKRFFRLPVDKNEDL